MRPPTSARFGPADADGDADRPHRDVCPTSTTNLGPNKADLHRFAAEVTRADHGRPTITPLSPAFRRSEPLEPVLAWHTIAAGLFEATYATGLFALSPVLGRVAALGRARGSGSLLQPEHQTMRPW